VMKTNPLTVQITPSVRSCEKIGKSGTDSPFRAGQLRIFKRLRGAKKVSGPGFSIFSQLLSSTLSNFQSGFADVAQSKCACAK